ncbi:uncharacterized protein DUF3775 [Roseibium hamelinense]|uniref:Uncharacterized protein DUF3775 n=1 Tax=Roseibium hamelinense TaxID=150831 RepID=A0A562T934_9HYPH|nr:DUF3775 domain-containing protein [Roseibium hamelinense]MTI45590.1 DUF3775 domain-containing protein [Roseibium hamelinense]TWI90032.1 uncharacterized protein DUF3775 [Roseibium hamelinense]
MAVDLSISADTVRLLIQKARAAANTVDDSFDGGHEGDIEFDEETLTDTHHHDGLAEEENDDMSEAELRELIDDLNVDEAAELVAIAWIGRGDFEADDFANATLEAKERATRATSSYLLGIPLFPDYLEGGLDALGL